MSTWAADPLWKTRRTRNIHRIVWHVRRLWHSSICLSQCPLYIDCVHSAGWFASEMPLQLWPVLVKSSIYRQFNWAQAVGAIVTDHRVLMPHKEGLASWSNLLAESCRHSLHSNKVGLTKHKSSGRRGQSKKVVGNLPVGAIYTTNRYLPACSCRSHTARTIILSLDVGTYSMSFIQQ